MGACRSYSIALVGILMFNAAKHIQPIASLIAAAAQNVIGETFAFITRSYHITIIRIIISEKKSINSIISSNLMRF